MDDAPSRIEPRVREQPLDRPLSAPRHAIGDLARLLRGVNVDRPLRQQRHDRRELAGRHRAQAVRRDAQNMAARVRRSGKRQDEPGERIDGVHETPLRRGRRLPAESRMRVEHGQQRQRDAGAMRGAGDAMRELCRVGIGTPLRIVVHVVKLRDGGVPGLQHLDVGFFGDRLERVRVDAFEERVHRLAPGPETVACGAGAAGAARDGALERVRVQIRHSGNHRAGRPLRIAGRHRRSHGRGHRRGY